MASSLRLTPEMPFSTVNDWLSEVDGKGPLFFQVEKGWGFAPLVEGTAIGVLSELAKRSLYFEGDVDPKDLESLFGVALALRAGSDDLKAALWKRVIDQHGFLSTGRAEHRQWQTSILYRDPDFTPGTIRDPESFGARDAFRTMLQRSGTSGASILKGIDAEDLTTILYEALVNVHLHGRFTLEHQCISAVRGATLERMESEKPPSWLPKHLAVSLGVGALLSLQVVDLGPGMHLTLPKGVESKLPLPRINECAERKLGRFRDDGQLGLGTGLGLKKIHEAAQQLGALLFIRSRAYVGCIDYTDPKNRLAKPMAKLHPFLKLSRDIPGTSLGLLCTKE